MAHTSWRTIPDSRYKSPVRSLEDVLCIILSWPRVDEAAGRLFTILEPVFQTRVVSSTEKGTHPEWHEIGDAYFTEQICVARELFLDSGKAYLFLILGDTYMVGDRYAEFAQKAIAFDETTHPLGFYYPQQDYSWWQFKPEDSAREYAPGVYECPTQAPDVLQCLITRPVLSKCPAWDHRVNKIGWGVDHTICKVVRESGLALAQDKNFQVVHPDSRGYANEEAQAGLQQFVRLYGLGDLSYWYYEGEHVCLDDGHFEAGQRLWEERRTRRAVRTWREGKDLGCPRCAQRLRDLEPGFLARCANTFVQGFQKLYRAF